MTIILTSEQSSRWEEGGWSALRTEEDILEDLDRQRCTDVVAVCLVDGTVIFWVSAGEVI